VIAESDFHGIRADSQSSRRSLTPRRKG
jgi:hypothetical protein